MDINDIAKPSQRKDIHDHGLRFVMDYNKDRWGSVSRDEEGQILEKDVLENKNGEYVKKGENARIYFQNIGIIREYYIDCF